MEGEEGGTVEEGKKGEEGGKGEEGKRARKVKRARKATGHIFSQQLHVLYEEDQDEHM